TCVVITPFGATAPAMTFSAMGGSSQAPEPGAGYTVAIKGDRARWRASGSETWLKLSPASGTGPATVSVTADAAGVTAGKHQASVVIDDDDSGRQQSFPATLTVRAPKLTTTAASTFTVDVGAAPAGLAQQITLSDEIAGTSPEWAVSWSVKSVGVDWLHLSPTSGTTSPPSRVTLTVDAAKLLALDNGSHDATVVLSYDNADAAGQTLTVRISMDLCLPRADRIAPYLGTADRGGHFYLRGSGFACAGPKLVARLGTAELAKTVDSDTQSQADYAGLAAGRYPVRFDNHIGLELGSAELVVLAPPALAYQAISAPSRRERLVYDAERQTLYAVNRTDQSIERYARSGGTWSALRPIVVPDFQDVDLSPDGRLLLVASKDSLSDLDLTAEAPSLVEQAKNPDPFCGQHFAQMAVPNSGKVFVVTKLSSCSGFSDTYLYDLRSHAVTRSTVLFNGIAAASADGSRIFMGSNGLSPAPEVSIFNALNDSIVRGPVDFNLFAVSVSGDAARVILQGTEVYSRALSLTGRLPAGGGAVASRDSSGAYVYRDDGDAGPRLEVFDLNGDLTAGALYPLLKTVRLADSPNTAAGGSVQMVPTPEDSAVFVSGNSRVLVVPVN
ncbi:MAG: BACON domain-containing protein, partial [Myxococcales bacterium]